MKSTNRDGILRGGSAALLRLLLLAAAGISAYLLSVSLSGGTAVGCGPGSGCDEVLKSRWAYVLNVPVSALAILVDLSLLLTSFACATKSTPQQRRNAWQILAPGSLMIIGAALWFVALQAFVLKRFCPWCMTAHACGAVAAVLLLKRLPLSTTQEKKEKSPALSQSTLVRLSVVAVMAIALFGAAQILGPRKTFTNTTLPSSSASSQVTEVPQNISSNPAALATTALTNLSTKTNTPAVAVILTSAPPAIASKAPNATNVMSVFGSKFHLDLDQVPVIGSRTAPLRMLSLFDYTCHHCQEMHERVVEVQKHFSNKLAVVSLPMPLDSQCNYLITRGTPAAHSNACVYAKIGLAVWRANKKALATFDDWIFASPTWRPPAKRAPPLTEVTNKAIQLVGAMMFDKACRDPWVQAQVLTDIQMYETSYKEFKNGSMPQFLIGTNLVTGILTTEQLRAVIAPYARAIP
jgi:uncharacterized membrane protein